ncbi:MAG: family 20 glycosylhydrolase [Bacteroidales bacterium]|nr:family 20 glycosylhydrolase [Bacteroidales bacterium]
MKRIYLLLLLAVALTGCGRRVAVKDVAVVPEPVFVLQKEGSYTLKDRPRISLTGIGQNATTVRYILTSLRQARIHPTMVATGRNSDIYLEVLDTANPELGEEGYLLEVRSNGIHLSANTEKGLFYAYQTLVQLLPADVRRTRYSSISLPECTILDYPRFEWRGAHLDVCRHFFPAKFVKKYIDVMALYKLNRLHWHLTDDHGWRLPSEKYPKLNTIGSWRVYRDDQPWGEADPPREGERPTYGGFYSKEDIADIVQYAAERGIEVVPEIEMPGHVSALLAAYPQMACDNYPYRVEIGPYWPPKAILCLGKDSTIIKLDEMLDEVMDLFPGRYIHLGGDEAFKDNWEQCLKCQRRIRTERLRDEDDLQNWLMTRMAKRVAARGKQAIGWDEISETSTEWLGDPDTTAMRPVENDSTKRLIVMAWRGQNLGLAAAAQGQRVIMCPTDYCYLDYYQANPLFQPKAIGGLVTLEKAYSFDPVPDSVPDEVAAMVMGGQCNLWTEYINTPSHAEYMLLPRMLAISECLWSPREKKDWNSFRRRVEDQKERLAARGYNYCEGSFEPHFTVRRVDDNTMNISISTEVPNTYIFYTTDSSTPTRKSPIYLGPINLARGTHIKILPVYKDQERDTVYEYVIK